MRVLGAICLLSAAVMAASPVWATDQMDLSVALKTLPLLTNKITGPAIVAIVYDTANAESKADAEAIKAIIDSGLEAPGGVKLAAQMTGTGELSKLSGTRIAFLAHGLPVSDYNAVGAAAAIFDRTRPGDPTKEYAAYLQGQAAWLNAQDAQRIARNAARVSKKPVPPALDKAVDDALREWENHGFKKKIEDAFAFLQTSYNANVKVLFASLDNLLQMSYQN